jgi:hypothetical membrane protein
VRVPTALGAGCGIAAPVAFVGAWVVAGLLTEGYDPFRQPISELAREGAPHRALMAAGFVAFGVLLPVWARLLARALGSRALGAVVTVAGLATLAVAALPLTRDGGGTQDVLHGVAALVGYVAMAATPLVAAPRLGRLGLRRAAAASVGVGVLSAAALTATALPVQVTGALQRTGLTVVDLWHVAAAAWVLSRSSRTSPVPHR